MSLPSTPTNGSTDLESIPPSFIKAQQLAPPSSTPSVLPPSTPRAQDPQKQRSSKLFFDLSSEKAVRLRSDLINRTRDYPNLVTTTISEATHILVEHRSPLGDELVGARASLSIGSSPRFPRVLTLRWVEDSLRLKHWQPEETYSYPSPVEHGEGELKGVAEEERLIERSKEEDQPVKTSPTTSMHDQAVKTPVESVNAGVDHPSTTLPASKLWTSDEDDALALFLLSAASDDYTAKDENGLDIFDRFAATENTRRPAAACRYHYKSWKWTIEDRMDKLGGGRPRAKAAKVKKVKRSSTALKPVVVATDELSKTSDETVAAQVDPSIIPSNAEAMVSEDANFARFLASLNTLPAGEGVSPSTFELYSTSVHMDPATAYQNQSSIVSSPSEATSHHWFESLALSYVQATSNLPQPRETRPRSRRSNDDPSDQPSNETQKKPRLESLWTNNSAPTPSPPVAVGYGSTSSLPPPFQPPSTHPPPPSPSPSLSHSYDQHWYQISHAAATSRTSSSHDAASSSSSSGTSSSNLPRRRDQGPSLLRLGTAPSSCLPSTPFCWFCSSATSPSFSPFFLAGPSESNPRELVKIKEGRSTCEGCSEWLKSKIEGGGEFLLGVREMGKLERMSWVRERLEERGLRERLRLMNGKL